MARVVDKQERRREIAMSCFDLIHEVGMKNITVAQVAQTAGIGKGTIYEYFENKDDIIFEIINVHIEYHHQKFLKSIENVKTTKEKLFYFLDFVMNDTEENQKHFNGYREYLSTVLADKNDEMCNFNSSCNSFFQNQLELMIQEGIEKNELLPVAKNFVEPIMVFEKGVVLMKMTQIDFDAKKTCEQFLNTIFDLIEVKND